MKEKTVAQLVSENYKTADVFKKYEIDFCCGGGLSLSEICKRKNLNVSDLVDELLNLDDEVNGADDYNSWPLQKLMEHIMTTHHKYVQENIPLIRQYADKVAKVHGHHYDETVKIRDIFYSVSEELLQHMMKEERILFPFIGSLIQAAKDNSGIPFAPFGTVTNPIKMMEVEHENAGNEFKEIAALSNQFTAPPEACNTFRVLYAKLNEFEEDLHLHIHLENNILFPKAKTLESKLLKFSFESNVNH